MNLQDHKYQTLSIIGSILLFLGIFSDNIIPIELRIGLLGLAAGWLLATWTLRFLIRKEEIKKSKRKGEEILQELKKEANSINRIKNH